MTQGQERREGQGVDDHRVQDPEPDPAPEESAVITHTGVLASVWSTFRKRSRWAGGSSSRVLSDKPTISSALKGHFSLERPWSWHQAGSHAHQTEVSF